jgi:sulfur carrier protein
MAEIELNGSAYQLSGQHDLAALVAALGLEGQALAVAVNRQVIPRQGWAGRALQAGDKVDIVRAIGGG